MTNYVDYLMLFEKCGFVERVMKEKYKKKFKEISFIRDNTNNGGALEFMIRFHNKYHLAHREEIVFLNAYFGDFYCIVKNKFNEQDFNSYTTEYAKMVYSILRTREEAGKIKPISVEYKQKYMDCKRKDRLLNCEKEDIASI